MSKRIAIIGAGASGLAAMRCCLEEGLTPVCFERRSEIGGLWNFTENAKDGQACVMKSTVINTSKEMMCYSDFPIPKEFPNYMHNTKVQEYFELYANHFELAKYIKFNTEIKSVKRTDDFAQTGRWNIHVKDLTNDTESTEVFDAVYLCTGHHADKHMPKFPGEESFKGKRVHTHDYKDHRGYEGKKVVVIGIGNSGGDVAVELSRICKQVYLSTRRGAWVFSRVGPGGKPGDMYGINRASMPLITAFSGIFNTLIEKNVQGKFNHDMYGLRPKHKALQAHPTVNDELPNRIICGSVLVKPNIKNMTETSVEFEDGSVEDDIDILIYATGYELGFPYLEAGVVNVDKNQVDLYKFAFPPDLEKPTLVVIGCIQPWGAIMPIAELQCRWAARVFKGDIPLPSNTFMWNDIKRKREAMSKRYVTSQRHTIQVDWIPFMDEIAEHVGCKPQFGKLLREDPLLAFKCYFDCASPYQNRLHGPNPWPGARDAIMTQWDRAYHTLNKNYMAQVKKGGNAKMFKMIAFFFLAYLFLAWLF